MEPLTAQKSQLELTLKLLTGQITAADIRTGGKPAKAAAGGTGKPSLNSQEQNCINPAQKEVGSRTKKQGTENQRDILTALISSLEHKK